MDSGGSHRPKRFQLRPLASRVVGRLEAVTKRGRTRRTEHRSHPKNGEPARASISEAATPVRQKRIFGIKTTVVRFGGAVYFVPGYAEHRPASQKILKRQYTEPPLHRVVDTVMTRRPGSMVHAGTFFGDMLPSFSRKTPGLVYAFEPVAENYLLARAVVNANHLSNVMLFHAGLGARPGLASIETSDGEQHHGGGSRVVTDADHPTTRTQTISLLSIDQFAIEDLSLIHLDVEGFELQVLSGAVESIRKHQPVIVIEDSRRNCQQLLNSLGYRQVGTVARNFLYLTEKAEAEFADLWES
jgi:FkbM family methyltransferase